DDVEAAPREVRADPLRLDLRRAVVADADERVLLDDRVLVRHAVDRGGRDEEDTANAGLERRAEHVDGTADVDREDVRARAAKRSSAPRSSTVRRARTTKGSNWRPLERPSSSIASSRVSGFRYGRPPRIVAHASQTATTRASSAISSPLLPSG